VQQLTLSIAETCSTLSLSRSSIYKLINEERLRTIKIGSRTLITMESIQALVDKGVPG
jgi:excisionase family DNA binding protein